MDKFMLSNRRAIGIGTYLVYKGYIEKETTIKNAEDGYVPSGFENRDGKPRISWMQSPILAKALLAELNKPQVKEEDKKEEKKKFSFTKKKN